MAYIMETIVRKRPRYFSGCESACLVLFLMVECCDGCLLPWIGEGPRGLHLAEFSARLFWYRASLSLAGGLAG